MGGTSALWPWWALALRSTSLTRRAVLPCTTLPPPKPSAGLKTCLSPSVLALKHQKQHKRPNSVRVWQEINSCSRTLIDWWNCQTGRWIMKFKQLVNKKYFVCWPYLSQLFVFSLITHTYSVQAVCWIFGFKVWLHSLLSNRDVTRTSNLVPGRCQNNENVTALVFLRCLKYWRMQSGCLQAF